MERSLREVKGSLLVAIPRPIATRLGWKAGDSLEFAEKAATVTIQKKHTERKGKAVVTIGYEGRSLDEFLTSLRENKVERLIDVRELAQSRRRGFSKTSLSTALKSAGIEYVHVRELGSPKAVRHEYREDGDFPGFEKKYRAHLAGQTQAVTILGALASEKRSALMCFEHDWTACHRRVLSENLEHHGFKSVHI